MSSKIFSAFGATEPLYDGDGERLRWFCPWVVKSDSDLARALETLASASQGLDVSRETFRIVAAVEMPAIFVARLSSNGFKLEACLPLAGASGLAIHYIGRCSELRKTPVQVCEEEQLLLQGVLGSPVHGPQSFERAIAAQQEFRVESVTPGNLSTKDRDRLLQMHEQVFPTFPYTFGEKLELMLANPDTYQMLQVRSNRNGQLYAFSNLEFNCLSLTGGVSVSLAEYDNSMRLGECAELGGIPSLGGILRLRLAMLARDREVDLCHAESRAGAIGINAISHRLGMHYGGRLEQHLLISGERNTRTAYDSRFESMNCWYLDRVDLAGLPRS